MILKMMESLEEKSLSVFHRTATYFPSHSGPRNRENTYWFLFFLEWLLLTIRLGRPPGVCLWMGIFMSSLKQFLSVHFFDRERLLIPSSDITFPSEIACQHPPVVEWLIMSCSLNIFHCFDVVCLAGCRVVLYLFRVSIFIKYNVDAFIILNMWFVTLTLQFLSIKHSCLVTTQAGLSSLFYFVAH